MDKALIAHHLVQAEDHVIQSITHLLRQREIVGELERHGQDASPAKDFLRLLQETHALHVQHRDRLKQQLG